MCTKPGDYIDSIHTRAGSYVDSIHVHCKEGEWHDRVGGSGGGDVYIDSQSGFNKIEVFYDDWVNGLSLSKLEGSTQASGETKGKYAVMDCGDKPIKGIVGTHKSDFHQSDDSPNSDNYVFSID